MMTEQDFTRFKKVFITKKASEAFAKKYDLKNYVIKEDHEEDVAMLVANMATKEDLVDLETRLSGQFRDELITQLGPLVSRNESINERQKELDEKFNRIMNSVDKLLIPISVLKEEGAVSAVQYSRQVEWNHKVAEKVQIPFDY